MNEQTLTLFDGLSDKLRQRFTVAESQELEFDQFLRQRLLPVITATQAALVDGRIDGGEILRIVIATSGAVRDGLESFSKTDKKVVVRETIQFVAGELLPGSKAIQTVILSDENLDGLIEFAYRFFVKARPATPGVI